MVTLKQIAEKAGVSTAAVSMALRNQNGVSPKRRQQILKVASELGWTHNSHVSSLMQHIRRTRKVPARATLALLMAHPIREARSIYHFVDRVFIGMEQRAYDRGYQTKIFWYNDPDMPPARLCHILASRGIQGVVVAPFRQFKTLDLDWERFSVAQIGGTLNHPPVHQAVEDYFSNIMITLSQLWASGYRRISLAWPAFQAQGYYFMLAGTHLKFFRDFAPGTNRILNNFITFNWSREGFLQWVKKNKPDAIITFCYDVLEWLQQAGYDVPNEIGVSVLNYCTSDTRFAGVDPLPERIGTMAIDLLVEQIECNEIGLPKYPKVITTRGQWREGSTVRPRVEPLPLDADILSFKS